MRSLVARVHVTLDGVMQAPGGPEEDPTGGFDLGGWAVGYFDDELHRHVEAAMEEPFDLVLGRRTYEILAAHWPYDTGPVADRMNAAAKHVASRTLDRVGWANSHLIRGDVATAVAELKAQDGPELQVHGCADLLQTLIGAGLVDEYRLLIAPVVAGSGKRLFGAGARPAGVRLLGAATTPSGVILASYAADGDIRRGSFAFEEPTEEERRRRAALEG